MNVEFRRTDLRRYAVVIRRDGPPPLEMNPAPGYDVDMPHDLLHFVVESELGLRRGIFGQVAAGGDAGTFQDRTARSRNRREAARARRRIAKRGAKLSSHGRDEAALSERATYICFHEWLARSSDGRQRRRAATMAAEAGQVRATQTQSDRQVLSEESIERICARLDELSARGRSLGIGESLVVAWPHDAVRVA